VAPTSTTWSADSVCAEALAAFLELSFALGALDAQAAEEACFACGASAVTLEDDADHPVLEPLPGELRLWPHTRLKALFAAPAAGAALAARLAAHLGVEPQRIAARAV